MTVRSPVAGAIAGAAAGIAGVLVLVLVLAGVVNADQAVEQGEANSETLQLIKDCTIEPAGKCAELQQQQSAMFTRMIALAAACADRRGLQTIAQIERCIREGMEDERAAAE